MIFRAELADGTTLTLDEGDALETLRADGWSISVIDSVLTVTVPHHAAGHYRIPILVTHPDQSIQASWVEVFVDYLVHIPLSVQIPVLAYLRVAESSTSSMRA